MMGLHRWARHTANVGLAANACDTRRARVGGPAGKWASTTFTPDQTTNWSTIRTCIVQPPRLRRGKAIYFPDAQRVEKSLLSPW
jgi:hypothetical protein